MKPKTVDCSSDGLNVDDHFSTNNLWDKAVGMHLNINQKLSRKFKQYEGVPLKVACDVIMMCILKNTIAICSEILEIHPMLKIEPYRLFFDDMNTRDTCFSFIHFAIDISTSCVTTMAMDEGDFAKTTERRDEGKDCYDYAERKYDSVIGRTFSTVSASLLVVEKLSDISPLFFIGVLQAMVPLLFMDIYVNGVNQLSDLEIDKINKPYLPLASGQVSFTTGAIIVASSLTLSCSNNIAYLFPPFSLPQASHTAWEECRKNGSSVEMEKTSTTCGNMRLGYLGSHISNYIFRSHAGIALFKDVPDIDGDQAYGIQSFAARFGQKRVFWICVCLFEMAFGIALMAGLTSSSLLVKIVTTLPNSSSECNCHVTSLMPLFRSLLRWTSFFRLAPPVTLLFAVPYSPHPFLKENPPFQNILNPRNGLGHAALAWILWYQAKFVDLTSKASMGSFFMLIWKFLKPSSSCLDTLVHFSCSYHASLFFAVDALNIIKASLININRNLSNWDGGDPYTSNWTGVTQADAQKLISRFPGSFKEASESMTQQDHKNNHAHAPQKEEGRGSNNKDSSLVGYGSKGHKIHYSGPLLVLSSNMDQMLKDHDRQIQEDELIELCMS
ncbi:Glycinol 4-dimethylallyltransferase [Vigna angularis]|uniref:Glycinol 4-dimethylallyltransferase n=2 Tax=Phaseolus angularis TaxID=3914 RepID=A0A8T0KT35_PHAAN|nr:Glycinol 4-dimethylallyltransferase [Vigna angularis]